MAAFKSFDELQRAGKAGAGWIPADMIGAGILPQLRTNVQHPYDRMFIRNTSNLAGLTQSFFQVPISGSYTPLNGTAQITKGLQDTNWDQANQAQYDYILTGMYYDVGTLEYQPFQASPNDLSSWPEFARGILEDSTLQIVVEDNILTRQKAAHVPSGKGLTGGIAATGTAAAPQSQALSSNGISAASNIFSFGRMALWIPKGTRLNVVQTFGPSLLAASFAYLPASNNKIWTEVRFQGIKLQPVV